MVSRPDLSGECCGADVGTRPVPPCEVEWTECRKGNLKTVGPEAQVYEERAA